MDEVSTGAGTTSVPADTATAVVTAPSSPPEAVPTPTAMASTHEWRFPCPRTHAGMLLGNGVLGAMIWGEGGVLRITLGRADLWDHRGGFRWTAAQSFANIRRALEARHGRHALRLRDGGPRRRRRPPGRARQPGWR